MSRYVVIRNAAIALIAVASACESGPIAPDGRVLSSLQVAPNPVVVELGATHQMKATLQDPQGDEFTGPSIFWTSQDPGVATVSSSGLVTGLSIGETNIAASASGVSATSLVKVVAAPVATMPVATVAVSPPAPAIVAGTTQQLSAVTRAANGNVLTGRETTWTTNAPGIATVSGSGLVTGIAPGQATITATSEGRTASAVVTVTVAPVATVDVSPTGATFVVGSTQQLTAVTKSANGGC